MKTKSILLIILIFSTTKILSAQNNNKKHWVGISTGLSIPWENSVYADFGDFEIWPDNKVSPVFNIFYEYQLSKFFKIGAHLNVESSKIDETYPFNEKEKINRYGLGFHWIGSYPNNKLAVELGGYLNSAFLSSEDWDSNLKGVEFGIMAGPAYDLGDFKLALHVQPGFSYFFSGDYPEEVLLMYPRVLLKFSYKLK